MGKVGNFLIVNEVLKESALDVTSDVMMAEYVPTDLTVRPPVSKAQELYHTPMALG